MGVIFYTVFLWFFRVGVHIAALFNGKAKKWVRGRKDIFRHLEAAFGAEHRPAGPEATPLIWMHCASLGEFEQGRPLIEAMKAQHPGHRILLTFFSPSGYEVRKNYPLADQIFYLPMDSASNARRFLEITRPSLVIFVKYEFWYYYLKKIKYREIPLILVSALFWKEMSFFKWYGSLQRKMLTRFDHLFVQDVTSKKLLEVVKDVPPISISGDTRFDRVASIAATASPVPLVEWFLGRNEASRVIIAGSTWEQDDALLAEVLKATGSEFRLIIAPHEIGEKHLQQVKALFPAALSYRALQEATDNGNLPDAAPADSQVLLIDNIGLLSRLYQYGTFSYIGGGFGKGIHNTLEAAVYGRPVMFGPVHHKFREARELIAKGGAFSIDGTEAALKIIGLFGNEVFYATACNAADEYVKSNRGATGRIIAFVEEKGWV